MKKCRNGKAQFITSLEVITSLLNAGQTGLYIYEYLVEGELIAISYRQFLRYLADINPNGVDTKVKQKQAAPEKNAATAGIPSRRNRRVLHDPTMTEERRKEIFG